jgi:MFS family permease
MPAPPNAPTVDPEADPAAEPELGGRYPNYVLGVLVLVYVFNFLDRNILSILNEKIKADLGFTDAQMGFLYGTAFAVFYALFGIPLGRLADVWVRRSEIALGLVVWSGMTALSGIAHNFAQMAAARIGVGVGEASASPAAFSMLSDYFPSARRATVLSIYSSGIYIGAGLGLMIGGQVVDRWDSMYASAEPPFGLRGWQVAFFVVGLPGLLLALWVRSLREPQRGQADGIITAPESHPWREFFLEMRSVLPLASLRTLHRLGADRSVFQANALAAGIIALAAAALVMATGDRAQWIALGIGLYAAFSWVQSLNLRDRPTAALVLGTPSLRSSSIGLSFLAFTGYGLGYWTVPFFIRVHGLPEAQVGTVLGILAAVGGWLGVTLGGVLADALRRRRSTGRLFVAMGSAVLPVPLALWLYSSADPVLGYWLVFPLNITTSMWIGVGASTVQDLVLPRMRASASAFYLLFITFIGLALGPYSIGKLSDALGSLRLALMLALLANAAALAFLISSARHLTRDEASLRARARAAGETGI